MFCFAAFPAVQEDPRVEWQHPGLSGVKEFNGRCDLGSTARSQTPAGCHERTKTVITTRTNAQLRPVLGQFPSQLLAVIRATGLVFLTAAQMTSPVFALDEPAKPRPPFTAPLPPVRPADAGVPAPAQSPTVPASPTLSIGAPTPPADLPLQPRHLPPATRTRMHECGVEWQKMKESGAAADKIWFDFARVCLAK